MSLRLGKKVQGLLHAMKVEQDEETELWYVCDDEGNRLRGPHPNRYTAAAHMHSVVDQQIAKQSKKRRRIQGARQLLGKRDKVLSDKEQKMKDRRARRRAIYREKLKEAREKGKL